MSVLVEITLEPIQCANCSMVFGVPGRFQKHRRDDHKTFFCPNGHTNWYPGKSDEEELRDELAREKHHREQAAARVEDLRAQRDAVQRRLSATQGVVTRHKRKIAAGRCPCCSRKFSDLAEHMKAAHPKWDPTREAEERAK